MQTHVIIHKNIGETPLEAMERFRAKEIAKGKSELLNVPMTYAGRLDPMAEGQLLILIGEECKKKDEYLGLDKEYEVEVLFGVTTDTYDALGLVTDCNTVEMIDLSRVKDLRTFVGKFNQPYPPYSSKTVDGVQLHQLSRSGDLPEEMPTKEVEIYSIDKISEKRIPVSELMEMIEGRISKVNGDFRQEEITNKWKEFIGQLESGHEFSVIKIKVLCSSGTYMRSLAHHMGKLLGCGAIALSINRTKIVL